MVDNDDELELELEDECDGLVAPELGAADDQVRVQRVRVRARTRARARARARFLGLDGE